MRHRLSFGRVFISLIIFTLLWAAVTDAWGISTVIFGSSKTVWQKYIYDISCRIVWVLPLFFLLAKYKSDLPISLTAMFTQKINVKLLFTFLAVFTTYAVGSMLLNHGRFRINPSFSPFRQISFYLVVGFVEELVYRGWALNAFSAVISHGKAYALSIIFFILLHWPAYIIRYFILGTFETTQFLLQSLVVLITGLLFGYVFKKNKSIWIPVILHTYFDLIVDLLVG